MEQKTIIAYEGKFFNIILKSSLGSTNYGWCLASLPEGIVLAGTSNGATKIGETNQMFVFGVTNVTNEINITLEFKLLCLSDYKKCSNTVFINVKLVPADENMSEEDFITYSENSAIFDNNVCYDMLYTNNTLVKYGFPNLDTFNNCDTASLNKNLCNADSAIIMKYGYPGDINIGNDICSCETNDNMCYCNESDNYCGNTVKGVYNSIMPYGYPLQTLKYGYPPIMKYGYPPIMKYGYPPQTLKYGYPQSLMYGYPSEQ